MYTISIMRIEYDPVKTARNIEKHGLSFDEVAFLDWPGAIVTQDSRKDYGEIRWAAFIFKEDEPSRHVHSTRR